SGGRSTRVVAGYGGQASDTSQLAHSGSTSVRSRTRLPCAARGRGGIIGPAGAASEASPLIVRGVRPVLQASVQAALRALHFRGMIAPNKSFKPNALRYTNNMADKACHGVGSATHVGLTQALGPHDRASTTRLDSRPCRSGCRTTGNNGRGGLGVRIGQWHFWAT